MDYVLNVSMIMPLKGKIEQNAMKKVHLMKDIIPKMKK